MIILSIEPLPRRRDLGRHLALALVPLFADLLFDLLRHPQLLLVVGEDRATILRPRIHALPIQRRGVMHAEKELEQLSVTDFVRVEHDEQRLGMSRASGAHGAIRRGVGPAARVAHARVQQALAGREVLAEQVLDAPEAAGGERGALGVGWVVAESGGAARLEGHAGRGGGERTAEEAGEEWGEGVCEGH